MKHKRSASWLLALVLALLMPFCAVLAQQDGTVTILHTNDAHCNYLLYDRVATLAQQADLLVDAGDAIQGDVIGTLSEGEYIVDIMNYLGYDLAVPGNHEFDFGMDQFLYLARQKANFPYLAANFRHWWGCPVLGSYEILEVNGVKVGFVGIATPESFTKSTPTYFQNRWGQYIYSFAEGENGQALYRSAQRAIDRAKRAGADYIVCVGHLGVDLSSSPWTSYELIANTTGIDVFIDGHSHTTLTETVADYNGDPVLLQQTGTKLANAGLITIHADGTIEAENIPLENVQPDPGTTAYIASITSQFEGLVNQVVARSEVDLTIYGADGQRAVRRAETNLGDFCADAYRTVMGADIAFVNGGGVRADIAAGDVTYGNIVSAHPFGNELCLVEVTGGQIRDALELGASALPYENGGFLQVSGLSYTIDPSIPSPVILDEKDMLVGIEGERRVRDILVNGQPLDLNATYTLASHDYMLKNQGDGYTMFGTGNVVLLQDSVMTDNQALITYVEDYLGGVIGQQYAAPAGRITVLAAE